MTRNDSRKATFLRVQLSTPQLRAVTGGGDGGTAEPVPTPPDAEVLAVRDAATGLPTGQRMHKPFVIR